MDARTLMLEALGAATTAAPPLLSCKSRVPQATCGLTNQTCGGGVGTQQPRVQGAAMRVAWELYGQGSPLSLETVRESFCGDTANPSGCLAEFQAGYEDEQMVRQILTEVGYTVALSDYQFQKRVSLHRGLALPPSHPLVRRLEECESRGERMCRVKIGRDYIPHPIESWAVDKEVSEGFARLARGPEVPVLLGRNLHPRTIRRSLEDPGTLPRQFLDGALPLISAMTNQGCIGSEVEIALLSLFPFQDDDQVWVERVQDAG